MSIERAYNSWAIQYDTNENKTRDLDARSTAETLTKYDFKKVIELGCGTGKNTSWLLERADQIIALDFSDEMLAIARQKISKSNVTFTKADISSPWNIEDHFADLITSSLTLEHICDLGHIFRQAHQKLKKGGLFFISELHPYKQYSGSGAQYESESGRVKVEVFLHHITDFTDHARKNNFELLELEEWFDEGTEVKLPRLVSFVFRKN